MNNGADKIGDAFADSLIEVIMGTSGFFFEVLSSESDSDFDGTIGLMRLEGEKSGMLFVSAEKTDMKVLCSFMAGVAQDEVTEDDIRDAMCEIVNMTAGGAKLRLGGGDYIFSLSPPFAISGENMSVSAKKRTRVISRTVGDVDMSVKLKIIY